MKPRTVTGLGGTYELIDRIPVNQPGWPWRTLMTANKKTYHIAVRDDGELVVVYYQMRQWVESCIVPVRIWHYGL